jgi:hypothetical protein
MTARRGTAPRDQQAQRLNNVSAFAMVGRVLFRDDWIGELSKSDTKLLEEHGPKDILSTGDTIEIIARCPTADIAKRVDRALGRHYRMLAQWNTARRWLIEKGPPANFGTYDAGALKRALQRLEKIEPSDLKRRGRGRKASVGPRVEAKIRDCIERGEHTLSSLYALEGKARASLLGCAPSTATKALDRVKDSGA